MRLPQFTRQWIVWWMIETTLCLLAEILLKKDLPRNKEVKGTTQTELDQYLTHSVALA
jgi:hypothetical protein